MQVTIFSTKPFEVPFLKQYNQYSYELNFVEETLSITTASLAKNSQAVVIFTNDDASAPVLEKLHQLGISAIALRSAGYDHVDLHKASELGIWVANVPQYSPHAVAEHAVAMMLCLNRKLIQANARIQRHDFHLDGLMGFNMNGKTVGIIGTGKIGGTVARILDGFGCRLLGYDLVIDNNLVEIVGLEYTDLSTLIKESDIITLHCPLNSQTRYLINKTQIENMKQGAMLINTARGAIINTKDAIEALKSGKLGSLGLDVYENEKELFFKDRSEEVLQDDIFARLFTFPNVLITGHQAFLTETAVAQIAETTMQNLFSWENKVPCLNELHSKEITT